MDIGEIFEMTQGTILKSDLIQVITADSNTLKDYDLSLDLTTITHISDVADYLGISIEDIYIDTKGLYNLCIYQPGIFIEICYLNKKMLEEMKVKERYQALKKYIHECIVKKDFYKMFFMVEKRIALITYKDFFDQIPDEDKYPIFRDLYTKMEYGFNYIGNDFAEEVLKYKKSDKRIHSKLNKLCDTNGYITIYRGIGKKSTSVEEAYSWTTHLYTAIKFATRFNDVGDVYTAKIHKSKVIDYIETRCEFEILAKFPDLANIEKMDFYTFSNLSNELNKDGDLFSKYHFYQEKIKDTHYFDPSSIHGKKHAKRVLMLSLIIAKMKKLKLNDLKLLAKAAVYHDIGRKDDHKCLIHGFESFKKLVKYGLVRNLESEETKILKYVIENHCIDDKDAFDNIKNYSIKNIDRALLLLRCFKDADNLDRVRIKDLDINYIRELESKKLPIIAGQLLQGI